MLIATDTYTKYTTKEEADNLIAILSADDMDGWSYKVESCGKDNAMFIVVAFDETGYRLGPI